MASRRMDREMYGSNNRFAKTESRNDDRGYPRSGDDYQKQAASTKNKKPLGGISNLYNANDSTGRMKMDIKNGVTPKTNSDNRGYPHSGDGYQKQAASNAKKPSDERNDTRGYARSGDISQKQEAKNSSSKPSILNLEKAMNDYAARKLNVKKVTSTPASKKSKGSAWDLISKAFNDENTMRKIKNYAGSYKVVDVGETYEKPKKKTTKRKER